MRRIASKSNKVGRTERDIFLQRKQIYEFMEEHLEEKVQQQKEVDTMLAGFSAEPDEI